MSAVLEASALIGADVMQFIIDTIYVAMLVIPYTRNLGYRYDRPIIEILFITPAVIFVMHIVDYATNLHDDMLLDMDAYMYLIAAIQTYQCYLIGFMLAVLMNHSFDMRKIKMWSIVFALAFAMTLLTGMCFSLFVNMYVYQGYLMFNEDFYGTERYTNGILTATPVVSTAITAFLAVFIMLAYCEQSKDIFIDKTEGAA